MRRVYIAGRYSRAEEFRGYRDALKSLGIEVTSRWIDHHGGALAKSFTPAAMAAYPIAASKFAAADIEDLWCADTFVGFTEHEGGGKGGRHVEFGVALCRRISDLHPGTAERFRLVVVGPRENIFTTLPYIEHYDTWDEFLVRVQDEFNVRKQVD